MVGIPTRKSLRKLLDRAHLAGGARPRATTGPSSPLTGDVDRGCQYLGMHHGRRKRWGVYFEVSLRWRAQLRRRRQRHRLCWSYLRTRRTGFGCLTHPTVPPSRWVGCLGSRLFIDGLVAWDATRCRLSPGERILPLVLILLTEREPLDQVDDAFRLTDPALLRGARITADDLGDDALGRALDKLAQAGPGAVFSAVAARAEAVEAIDRGGVH